MKVSPPQWPPRIKTPELPLFSKQYGGCGNDILMLFVAYQLYGKTASAVVVKLSE